MTGVDNLVEKGSAFRKMLCPFILFAVWLSVVEALPHGAPETACSTLTPVHKGHHAQSTASPYKISVQKSGNKVAVSIFSSNGEEMEGFVLQARSNKDKHKIIEGKFSQQDGLSKAIDCFDGNKNTLTHSDPGLKKEIKTEWVPSVDLDEDVIFRATVAKTFKLFWTEVDSAPIRITSRESAPPSRSPQEDSSSIYNNCFITENCFGLPRGCVDNRSCEILLSYKHTWTGISFTLKGLLQANAYMAMALSHDEKMGDDFVTACTPILAQESYNQGQKNSANRQLSTGYHISYINGLTSCSWTTKYLAEAPNGATFDLGLNTYYLLLAKGPFEEKSEKLGYHHSAKLASAGLVNFTAFKSTSAQDFNDSTKVYGVLEESSFTGVTEKHSVSISTTESSNKKSAANCCYYFTSKILFTLVITGLALVYKNQLSSLLHIISVFLFVF